MHLLSSYSGRNDLSQRHNQTLINQTLAGRNAHQHQQNALNGKDYNP